MNPTTDPVLVITTMTAADVDGFDADRAAQALADVKVVRGFIDRHEAAVTSHLRRLHERGESAPASDLHTRSGGVSAKEARRKERRAKALEQAPAVADALANGVIGAEHADVLANVTNRLDEAIVSTFFDHQHDLARDASRMTPEQFGRSCLDLVRLLERDEGLERAERQRRETELSKRVDRDGMYVLTARMHPELGHAVFNAIDAEVAALVKSAGDRAVDRGRIGAEALGNLVAGGHQAIRAIEAEIRLHVDATSLLDGIHEDSVCELDDGTPLPPTSVRRLLCNGRIVPIIIDADGVALNVGRQQRLATRTQRRALRAMYRTCAFHGCDVAFNRCEIHHIHEWELGGPSDLDNLLPLCSRHHHEVHEGGWTLRLAPDRTLTIRQPDGSVFATSPPQIANRRSRPSDGSTGPPSPPQDHRSGEPPNQLLLTA